jgi:hypothetical protein
VRQIEGEGAGEKRRARDSCSSMHTEASLPSRMSGTALVDRTDLPIRLVF